MNPVLRLVSGQSSNPEVVGSGASGGISPADEPTHEFVPGFKARPAGSPASVSASPALPPSSAALLQTGHLLRCRRCGELNGRSADACWNCEADLQAGTLPSGIPVAANSDTPPSLPPELPVLTASVNSNDLRSAHGATMPAPLPAASARSGPSMGLVATIVSLLVVLGAGGVYYYIDTQESEATAARSAAAAAARARAGAAPATVVATPFAAPAPVAPSQDATLSSVDAALHAAELVSQPKPESMAVYVPPTERVIAASAKAKAAAAAATRARSATRSVAPPGATTAAPVYRPAAPARPPAATAVCTPNVAALGLCSAPASSQTKE